MKTKLKYGAAISLIVVGTVLGFAFVIGEQVTQPHQCSINLPKDLPVVPFSVTSKSQAVIKGWHLPHQDSKGVLVLLHPIRGSRLYMLERARFLHAAGYSVVMFDFQAHGESQGERITLGHLERHDVEAVIEFTKTQYQGQPIAVIGISMGGAAALYASPLPIKALILESVYPDIQRATYNRVKAKLGTLAWLPTQLLLVQLPFRLGVSADNLKPIEAIQKTQAPVLIMSGADDPHTTASETKELFASAPEPKELWMVPHAGHIDLHQVNAHQYQRKVLAFLAQHMPQR